MSQRNGIKSLILHFDMTDPCFYEVHSAELISISTIDKTILEESTVLDILYHYTSERFTALNWSQYHICTFSNRYDIFPYLHWVQSTRLASTSQNLWAPSLKLKIMHSAYLLACQQCDTLIQLSNPLPWAILTLCKPGRSYSARYSRVMGCSLVLATHDL